MADLVTWSPRRGASGDDRYLFPDNSRIDAGPSDIYSDPPTLAEVNSGSGLNQIIAEYKRRRPVSDDILRQGYSIPPDESYMSPDTRIVQSYLSALAVNIQTIRFVEALPTLAYVGYNLRVIGASAVEGAASLRELLATDHVVSYMRYSLYDLTTSIPKMLLRKISVTYSEFTSDGGTADYITPAKYSQAGCDYVDSNQFHRYRTVCAFKPKATGSAKMSWIYEEVDTNTFDVRVYTATGLGKITPADWGSLLGTLVQDVARSTLNDATRYEWSVGSVTKDVNLFATFTNENEATNNPPSVDERYAINVPKTSQSDWPYNRLPLVLRVY